ncbi:P-loop NTPase fold protein [Methylovirgula sp. 4M-Z18]|uniref:P-loop NTPase fold protein n=1 Tax=Methylovirgula sp. 4M-Z18 TaxID=2293567 RepID=UPI00131466B0|nr:P-loop NTPase fold protein [Methylovirgula sp. 4M-Z18]
MQPESVRIEPVLKPVTPLVTSSPPALVLASDASKIPQTSASASSAELLAELAAHKRAESPFTIGIFGAAGAGKTFLLTRTLERLQQLTTAAAKLGADSPFASRLVVAKLDATKLVGDPATAVAASVHAALLQPAAGGSSYSLIAQEAAHATSDPQTAARDARERLNDAHRRLDGERQTLQEIEGRRAKLNETMLYDAGSGVDAYARANRSRIEQRMRAFGFVANDPIVAYKDVVRDVSGAGSAMPWATVFLRSLWAFGSQMRWLVGGVLLFALSWLLGYAYDHHKDWISHIWGLSSDLAPAALSLQSNVIWLSYIGSAFFWLALLCFVFVIGRAFLFTQPIVRGVALLKTDVAQRRVDLETQHQHQLRRVNTLTSEAAQASVLAEEAERRAPKQTGTAYITPDFIKASTPADGARTFLTALSGLLQNRESAAPRPDRIVVTLDGLDALDPQAAAHVLSDVHALLAHPGFILLAAINRAQVAQSFGADTAERLEKIVQLPLDVSGISDSRDNFVGRFMDRDVAALPNAEIDAGHSQLDGGWSEQDTTLLKALGPIAAPTPRAAKRFLNLVRFARVQAIEAQDGPAQFASLALALAVASGGTEDERAGLQRLADESEPKQKLEVPDHPLRLAAAIVAARMHAGKALTAGDLGRALKFIRRYAV